MAGLQQGGDCQPHNAGQDGGDDIVGDDPAADTFQGSQVILRDDPGHNGADDHGDYNHFDAVQPDIADETQLDHGFSTYETGKGPQDHGGENLCCQGYFLTVDDHTINSFGKIRYFYSSASSSRMIAAALRASCRVMPL